MDVPLTIILDDQYVLRLHRPYRGSTGPFSPDPPDAILGKINEQAQVTPEQQKFTHITDAYGPTSSPCLMQYVG